MTAAAVFLLATGIRAQVFSSIWPGTAAIWADTALTLVWVVGITASFSILDHMDGLCAGIAAAVSLFFAIFARNEVDVLVSTMAAEVQGGAAGFLRWNFKPAKIFMGDGGAMFLGFLMATLALKLRLENTSTLNSWLAPVLILGATIFDTALVTISRSRLRLLPFATPGKDHSAHRLANLGLGQRGAVLTMYVLGAVCGCAAIAVTYISTLSAAILAGVVFLAMLLWIVLLERAPFERQAEKAS